MRCLANQKHRRTNDCRAALLRRIDLTHNWIGAEGIAVSRFFTAHFIRVQFATLFTLRTVSPVLFGGRDLLHIAAND